MTVQEQPSDVVSFDNICAKMDAANSPEVVMERQTQEPEANKLCRTEGLDNESGINRCFCREQPGGKFRFFFELAFLFIFS